LDAAAVSDAAGRDENQDVALALRIGGRLADGDNLLLVVADGLGGHPFGEVASKIATDSLQSSLSSMPEGDVGLALKQAYRRANDAVFRAAGEEPMYAGMGTTLTSAVLRGKYATIANIGDSRAYLLRGDSLTQITRDHTVAADEVAAGGMTAAEARRSGLRNMLTSAIGMDARLDSSLPGIFELTLLPGDRFLLCSDGLYTVVEDADLRDILRGESPDVAAQDLVNRAKELRTTDNASAVVAVAVPTRVTAVPAPVTASRTGGVPGTMIAAAVAVLLVILLVLAVFVLGLA
jgi:protein phosphatase